MFGEMNLLKRKNYFCFLLFVLLVVILVGGWYLKSARAAKKEKDFSLVRAERRTLEKEINVSGEVEAEEDVVLRFKTSGKLAWVGVKEGDWVKKWQAIASLDQRELKKRFQKEMNNYLTTRWDWEQTQADYKDYRDRLLLTDEMKRILDKAQFKLDNAVLDVEIADLAVKYAVLVSPIEGIVTQVETPVAGVNITPAQAEFEIINPQSVYFEAKVDETDIGFVKEGQKVKITLDAYPEQEFEGKVERVAFKSTTVSGGRAYLTKISLPENKDLRFRVGLSGDGQIKVASKENALCIPRDALIYGDRPYVWVVKEGRAQKQEVEVGLATDDWVEIKSGIDEKSQIVGKGAIKVREGEKISG